MRPDQYYESEEFKELLSRYESAQRDEHSCYFDGDEFVDLSDYFLDNDNAQEALNVIDQGLSQHPDDEQLILVRAGVLVFLRRFDEAQQIVDSLNPDANYDVKYLQAQLYYAVDYDIEKADALFHEWVKDVEKEWNYNPSNNKPDAWYDDDDEDEPADKDESETQIRDAYIHVMMSYVELAGIDHEKVLRQWINDYLDRFKPLGEYDNDLAIADICRDENYVDLVVDIYTKLLDYDPYISRGWTVLAAAQYVEGQIDEAINSVEFALAIDANDVDALLTKANCMYTKGQFKDALQNYLKYRELTESHTEDHYIAYCYIHLEMLEEAKMFLDSAIEYNKTLEDAPNEQKAWIYYEIAEGYSIINLATASMETINMALALQPDNVEFLLHKGSLYLWRGEIHECVDTFSRCLRLADDSPSILVDISGRFLAFEYYDAACSLLETALSYPPSKEFTCRNDIYALLSISKFHLNQIEEAQSYLRTACDVAPDSVKIVFRKYLPQYIADEDLYDHIISTLAINGMND